jgi:hypothetical protein
LPGVIKENIVKGLESNINSLKKIQAVGYQFVSSNDMIYNTLSVSFKTEVREETAAQWESLLDTILSSKPFFFTNHYTGRNEIFVQDLKNNAYLINSAGRILWKLPMIEKIKGNAYEIDYYKNGKYQLLFATSNYIHLLDRNGNYVERYPVRLRSPASTGLSVFDYENNKNYRLFICGTDRIVYGYDKSGSTLSGWDQFKTNSTVSTEVEFFRVSGKDYLVLNDVDNMYILDRKGSPRVNVKEQIARAPGSKLKLTSGTSPKLVLSSRNGSLKKISFNGEVESVQLNEFSENHVFDYFDLDADGTGEYIFIDDDRIYAFDTDYTRMFTKNLESNNIIGPYGFVFSSSDRKLGYVDIENEMIHLIDSKGKDASGFPLRGSTSFSVGKFSPGGSYYLITGGRDSFLYNYEIIR